MNKSSAIRVFQMLSLEEQRGPLMAGMQILMRAYTHLRDCPESTENSLAMQQILSIIGPMEDENKSLSEQSEDLWSAVLEQVGPELSSKEIEKAENNAATGADWLERAINHVAATWPVEEGGEEILMEMAELRTRLYSDRTSCQEAQRKHQMAQAEILAREAFPYDN